MVDYKNYFVASLSFHYVDEEILRFWQIISQEYHLGIEGQLTARRAGLNLKDITVEEVIKRLIDQESIDYIIGYVPFMHVDIKVNHDVLIPRSETEELVDYIIHQEQKKSIEAARILEIGSGSGCIAIGLKHSLASALITSIDVSAAALEVARENAILNKVEIKFKEIDFLNEKEWPQLGPLYDIIVSNPPYIDRSEQDQMDTSVIRHEPDLALYADGDDPLIFYRLIKKFAEAYLSVDGQIYAELNALQSEEIRSIFENDYQVNIIPDLQGMPRILHARK